MSVFKIDKTFRNDVGTHTGSHSSPLLSSDLAVTITHPELAAQLAATHLATNTAGGEVGSASTSDPCCQSGSSKLWRQSTTASPTGIVACNANGTEGREDSCATDGVARSTASPAYQLCRRFAARRDAARSAAHSPPLGSRYGQERATASLLYD